MARYGEVCIGALLVFFSLQNMYLSALMKALSIHPLLFFACLRNHALTHFLVSQITASDEVLENLFKEFDHNAKGMIDYVEFREIFLRVCDVRRELEDRGVDVPSMIRKNTLRKMFKEILLEEEDRERRALTEARRYKQWMLNIRASKKILQKADFRSYLELRNALDAAGHVYVIGSGAYGQFNQPAAAGKSQINYEKILELWKDRVQPQQLIDRLRLQRKQEEQDEKRDAERPSATGMGALAALDQKIIIDPWMEAQESPFLHVNVSLNTASLWGRRIHQVAIAENTLFALADTGEVFSWGGNSYWWHEIQADSIYQKVWRGKPPLRFSHLCSDSLLSGDTTARSQLLLGTTGKTLPIDSSIENTAELLTGDDLKVELVKLVAKYYNVWEPPPIPAQRMVFIEKDILTRIEYDMLVFALQCRGKVIKEMTKMQLVEMLYEVRQHVLRCLVLLLVKLARHVSTHSGCHPIALAHVLIGPPIQFRFHSPSFITSIDLTALLPGHHFGEASPRRTRSQSHQGDRDADLRTAEAQEDEVGQQVSQEDRGHVGTAAGSASGEECQQGRAEGHQPIRADHQPGVHVCHVEKQSAGQAGEHGCAAYAAGQQCGHHGTRSDAQRCRHEHSERYDTVDYCLRLLSWG